MKEKSDQLFQIEKEKKNLQIEYKALKWKLSEPKDNSKQELNELKLKQEDEIISLGKNNSSLKV